MTSLILLMEKIKSIETREELYLEIPKGGIGAEIGVCKGINSMPLYFISKPSKMYLVDIWTEICPNGADWPRMGDPFLWYDDHKGLVEKIFSEEIKDGSVELRKEYGSDFLNHLEDDSLDWVYLDSDHRYNCIAIEINLAIQKVKKGGLIMGHDYSTVPQTWGSSIIRAVNERIQNNDVKMEAITLETWPSYLIRVL
jgi:hypothetical protein